MERAHRRLERLYEISKLLTRFQNVERTIPEVVAVVAQELSLNSAIFIVDAAGTARTLVWQARGGSPERLRAAKDHAQRACNYLVRSGIDLERQQGAKTLDLPRQAETEQAEPHKAFIILPLVVDHGAIFGALQLEASGTFDEIDLVFMNVVVNQLAIGLDRHFADQAVRDSEAKVAGIISIARTRSSPSTRTSASRCSTRAPRRSSATPRPRRSAPRSTC